jgi:hypothetical protein
MTHVQKVLRLRHEKTRIWIILRCPRGRFALTTALCGASSSYRPVRAMAVRKCSKFCQLFRVFRGSALFVRWVMHPYFSVGPSRQRRGTRVLPQRAGSSRKSWRIFFFVKKTPHYHRTGFEPQRASPFRSSQVKLILSPKQRAKPKTSARKTGSSMAFRKWVKAPRILGKAVRA